MPCAPRLRCGCWAAGRSRRRPEFRGSGRTSITIARDMGNGATADSAAVFVAAGRAMPARGREPQNGHATAGIKAHEAAHLNGHDAAQDGEIDGEAAVSAARRLTRGRVLVLNAS